MREAGRLCFATVVKIHLTMHNGGNGKSYSDSYQL